jgi:hypothetical protein
MTDNTEAFVELPSFFDFEKMAQYVDAERARRRREKYLADRREYYYAHRERYVTMARERYLRKKKAKEDEILQSDTQPQPATNPPDNAQEPSVRAFEIREPPPK